MTENTLSARIDAVVTPSQRLINTVTLYLVASLILTACANRSVFAPYPYQVSEIKQLISSNRLPQAIAELDTLSDDKDNILYLMERARAAQIGGEFDSSIADFEQVIDEFRVIDEKAKITLTGTAAKSAALTTNDNVIPYTGEAYERVFVHHFQALNFLFVRDLEAALVEVRRANLEQNLALERHHRELAAAAKEERYVLNQNPQFATSFSGLETAAGHVKNSFQNAYTFYASGVIYEVSGNLNDAYIDYKKSLEIFPNNRFLQQDVVRLATRLGMRDDLDRYRQRFNVKLKPPYAGDGELIVFFENGFAPIKREIKIPIASRHHIHTVAFPTYDGTWQANPPLKLSNPGHNEPLGKTEPIVYVQALAAKALQERVPALLLRQSLRLAMKNQIAEQSRKAFGEFAELVAVLTNVVTENADLRSWLTLPNSAQIWRRSLPAGKHNIALSYRDRRTTTLTVDIAAGRKTLLRVIATGDQLHTHAIVL